MTLQKILICKGCGIVCLGGKFDFCSFMNFNSPLHISLCCNFISKYIVIVIFCAQITYKIQVTVTEMYLYFFSQKFGSKYNLI